MLVQVVMVLVHLKIIKYGKEIMLNKEKQKNEYYISGLIKNDSK